MTPRDRLYQDSLRYLASLTPDDAQQWLDQHGPPGGEDRRLELSLPESLQRLLQRRRQQITAANLHRIGRYQELVEVLSDRGIPVCPLKGIFFLGTIYRDDPENRPMVDLDVLVRIEDGPAAVGALESSLGVRETRLSRRLSARSHERVLVGTGLVVEIHTRLGIRTGHACAWNDLHPAPGAIHDRKAHLLDRDTTLAYAIGHFVQHTPWSRRAWVEDILRWSQRGFDPTRVVERATSLGCRRLMTAGVRALRNGLGTDVAPGLPERDHGPGSVFSAIYAALSPTPGGSRVGDAASGSSRRWMRHLSTFLLADRLGDLVSFLKSHRRHESKLSSDS